MSSHAASISAWCTVFDWPSIVAATSVGRHGPASSSAARKKMAARSSQGIRDQSCHASPAASIARSTSAGPPWWTVASTWSLSCGSTCSKWSPVRTSLPPITIGSSICWPRSSPILRMTASRSGEPGA